MGTRGLFGFYYRGNFYVVYNHWDSYPEGLGAQIVAELKRAIQENRIGEWIQLLNQLKVVALNVPPTHEDIEKLRPYTDLKVSTQSPTDWYCLLRGCQGSLETVLKCGYIDNCVNDQGEPQWEEYAYIVNYDTNKLDFYEGNQLVNSYDFTDLPTW
jgi:putative hemolysin